MSGPEDKYSLSVTGALFKSQYTATAIERDDREVTYRVHYIMNLPDSSKATLFWQGRKKTA